MHLHGCPEYLKRKGVITEFCMQTFFVCVNTTIFIFIYSTRYRQRFGVKEKYYGLLKFEIDFSRCFMVALVDLFTGMPLEDYINEFWSHFTSPGGVGNWIFFPFISAGTR